MITKYLYVYLFLSGFISVYAQTFTQNNQTEPFIESQRNFEFLGINNSPNPINQNLEGNSVILRQIGEYNRTSVITKTDASDIKVVQYGNFNRTGLIYSARTVYADLVQDGNYNTIKDFIFDPSADVSLELQQEGNGLYFERFGSNSLTESLKFRQTAAAPEIIVRSFE